MHSFQPSRGRIFFEVLGTLTISASFAGAWFQTGSTALLPAAAVSLLYGLVHLFDMRRRRPVVAAEPQRIDFEPKFQPAVPAHPKAEVPVAAIDLRPPTDTAIGEAELVELPTLQTGASRRKGGSRKGSGRRASTSKEAKVIELAPTEEAEASEPAPTHEAEIVGLAVVEEADKVEPVAAVGAEVAMPASPEETEAVEPVALDQPPPTQLVPLFEPEPFARQHRAVFGRKAG